MESGQKVTWSTCCIHNINLTWLFPSGGWVVVSLTPMNVGHWMELAFLGLDGTGGSLFQIRRRSKVSVAQM
eukprot:CAMPEP_0198226624 /NCGR_PEP_ID=MMETSP1445-20131203/105972_1 /TAXON_ID=36898 /ORGANISM="Pyramimonas sp., Strain CCMP2087" /LENGTH=70 /DNA_ID=CAMNT_0043906469 /DNA_START=25 /DNA_END=237 /DNA_ORIENTATION=+